MLAVVLIIGVLLPWYSYSRIGERLPMNSTNGALDDLWKPGGFFGGSRDSWDGTEVDFHGTWILVVGGVGAVAAALRCVATTATMQSRWKWFTIGSALACVSIAALDILFHGREVRSESWVFRKDYGAYVAVGAAAGMALLACLATVRRPSGSEILSDPISTR